VPMSLPVSHDQVGYSLPRAGAILGAIGTSVASFCISGPTVTARGIF
jgi:hypothetical protein